jgi:hypothetical protein
MLFSACLVMAACGGGDPSSTSRTTPPTPVPPAADSTSTPAVEPTTEASLDASHVLATLGDAVYRVEYLGCGGVGTAAATAISPTHLVTASEVASLAQLVAVVSPTSKEAFPAQVLGTSDQGFTVIEVSMPVTAIDRAAPTTGSQVLLAGSPGADPGAVRQLIDTEVGLGLDPATGLDGAPGTGVYDAEAHLVGVVSNSAGRVIDNPTEAVAAFADLSLCSESAGVLDPVLAESALASEIREVALAQELAGALATGDWDLVRRLDSPKANLTDADFERGWGTLEASTILPISASGVGAATRWRVGLVAHERIDGTQITRPFCVNWDVDPVAGTVVQTGIGSVRLDDLTGWVDPITLLPSLRTVC